MVRAALSEQSERRRVDDRYPHWLTAAIRLGVPALISLFMVYSMMKYVVEDQRALRTEHQQMGMWMQAMCYNQAALVPGDLGYKRCDAVMRSVYPSPNLPLDR